ncbi:MAG TPA: FKBP-type peptidyl-prolyl cis-trans isomerase [Gemmatimonadaceae bacterium]|nr:FKBP-type peptidyl-prolyl cis-trans isomerase [Gemmatimonadaceae bacterium]
MKRFAFLLAAAAVAIACNHDVAGLGPPSDPATETFNPSLGVDISQMTRMSNGVYYRDVVEGPLAGDTVTAKTVSVKVNYAGYLKDGKLIDSGSGVTLPLSGLITGFKSGMMGMRVGGKRKLVIPSELGYGGDAIKNPDLTIKIPRQSTLIFDVEVLAVTDVTS